MKTKAKPDNRIMHDDEVLDDLWQTNVDVHIEALGKGDYFIGTYHQDGTTIGLYGKKVFVAWDEAVSTSTEDVLSNPPASNSSGVSVSTSTEEP